jgi:ribose transport system substrate-binding protein
MDLVIKGDVSLSDGLCQIYEAWEKITDKYDRNVQLGFYNQAYNILPMGDKEKSDEKTELEDSTLKSEKLRKTEPLAKIKVGFSQSTTTESWRLQFNKELRLEAEKYPEIDLTILDAHDDNAQQIKDLDKLIENGMDYILISPKTSLGYGDVLKKAKDKKIKVIVLDRDFESKDYDQFIGGDNEEIGRSVGEYIVRVLGGKGSAKGKILEIWGGRKSTPAQLRHKGFYDVVVKENITIVNAADNEKGVDVDWKQDKAYELTLCYLSKNSDIDLIYAHNDSMAYGAYRAVQELRLKEKIKIVGIDGLAEEGKKWVDQGAIDATFVYETPGAEAIRQVIKMSKGEKIDSKIVLPTHEISKG